MEVDRDVSYILRSLLNSLGLDEEQRQRRITCQTMSQVLESFNGQLHPFITNLFSGSGFETTTVCGLSSDLDVMHILNFVRVITDIKDWRNDGLDTYLMDSTGCSKAFVKLYRLSRDYPGPLYADMLPSLPPWDYVDKTGQVLLSNMLLRSVRLILDMYFQKAEIHGPAYTTPAKGSDHEKDHVVTLRCDSFPREAKGWKQRQTPLTRARIDPEIININHCYMVAIGDKHSPTEHLEWRLSFSHIENKLIHAWNNVQYQCYVLMKFIKKGLIQSSVLCSYHFKTLVMWMNEEHAADFFSPSNFERCALKCLDTLVQAAKKRSLPHYFVEGCNLFYPKLTNDINSARKLVEEIENIVATWPRCLYNISRRNFGRMIRDSIHEPSLLPEICVANLEARRDGGGWYELSTELIDMYWKYFAVRNNFVSKGSNIFCLLSKIGKMIDMSNYDHQEFIAFASEDILCNVSLELIRCGNTVSNKTSLRNTTAASRYVRRPRISCCIDTLLKIAAHLVMAGNHRQGLKILEKVEAQQWEYAYFRCLHDDCVSSASTRFRNEVFDNMPSMMEYFKHYLGPAVTYKQHEKSGIPKGLVYEMFRSTSVSDLSDPRRYLWHREAVVHCPVYLHYLRFLSHKMQGRVDHQQDALCHLEVAVKEFSKYPDPHQETNHNILGYCHRTTGDRERAYKEYRKSLEKEKYNNAVIWHLAVLLRSKIRGKK